MSCSTARVPKWKVSSAKAAGKEDPKMMSVRLSIKPTPVEVEVKPEEAAAKDKPSDKKVRTKGNRGANGKKLKWLTKKLKIYLQKVEKLKMRNPASDEAGWN